MAKNVTKQGFLAIPSVKDGIPLAASLRLQSPNLCPTGRPVRVRYIGKLVAS